MTPLERRSLIFATTGWCGFGAGWLVWHERRPGSGMQVYTELSVVALLCLITFVAAIVCAVLSRRRSPRPYRRDYGSPAGRIAFWLSVAGLVTLIAPVVTTGAVMALLFSDR